MKQNLVVSVASIVVLVIIVPANVFCANVSHVMQNQKIVQDQKKISPTKPANIMLYYDMVTSSPPLPTPIIEAAMRKLRDGTLPESVVSNQLEYLKLRQTPHIIREKADYWTDGGSNFCWHRYVAYTWRTANTLYHAIMPPKQTALVEIVPLNKKTDASVVEGDSQEPLLGFIQPLRYEYVTPPETEIHFDKNGAVKNFKLIDPSGGGPPLVCRQVYDSLGRLVKFNIDEDEYTFSDFKQVKMNSYVPQSIVWNKFSYIDTDSTPYRYVLSRVTLHISAIKYNMTLDSVLKRMQFLKGTQVHDGRYKSRVDPDGISYDFDGVGSLDAASQRHAEDPYSSVPPNVKLIGPEKINL